MNKKSTKPKKTIKLNATFNCPVCEKHRSKGDHTKCSRIMQLKNMKESGEIQQNNCRLQKEKAIKGAL